VTAETSDEILKRLEAEEEAGGRGQEREA